MGFADLPSRFPPETLSDWWRFLPKTPDTLESAIELVARLDSLVREEDEGIGDLLSGLDPNQVESLQRWLVRIGHWVQSNSCSGTHCISNWLTIPTIYKCRLKRIFGQKIVRLNRVRFTAKSRLQIALNRLKLYRKRLPSNLAKSGFDLVPLLESSRFPSPQFAPFYFSACEDPSKLSGDDSSTEQLVPTNHSQSDTVLMDLHNYQSWCRVYDLQELCAAYNHSFLSLRSPWRMDIDHCMRKVRRTSEVGRYAYRSVRLSCERFWEQQIDSLRHATVAVLKSSGELPCSWTYEPWKPIRELADLREWLTYQRDNIFYSDTQWADPRMREPSLIRDARNLAVQANRVMGDWGRQPLAPIVNAKDVAEAENLVTEMIRSLDTELLQESCSRNADKLIDDDAGRIDMLKTILARAHFSDDANLRHTTPLSINEIRLKAHEWSASLKKDLRNAREVNGWSASTVSRMLKKVFNGHSGYKLLLESDVQKLRDVVSSVSLMFKEFMLKYDGGRSVNVSEPLESSSRFENTTDCDSSDIE